MINNNSNNNNSRPLMMILRTFRKSSVRQPINNLFATSTTTGPLAGIADGLIDLQGSFVPKPDQTNLGLSCSWVETTTSPMPVESSSYCSGIKRHY